MEFEITYKGQGTIFKYGYYTGYTWTFKNKFKEEDYKNLIEYFSNKTPDDDVSDLVKQYLPELAEDIEYMLEYDALENNYFHGKIEDLLNYFFQKTGVYPKDIIEVDIQEGRFNPGCNKWNLLSDAELISKWCETFREELEYNSFKYIQDFFNERCNNDPIFFTNMNYCVWFSRELYDEIKRRRNRLYKHCL